MENEYGITVANKYALFLNEDEDSLFLKIQDTKANKKAEKTTKKNATKEKEGKPSNKQSGSSAVAQDKKAEKVDQFSSPTVNNESAPKSAGASGQGTAPSSSDVNFESGRSRPPRDRAKPRSNASRENKDHGDDSKSSEQHRDQRPPRIRNRGGGSGGYRQDRGGFGENRQFRSETDAAVNENTDRPNSVGNYERHERRTPRNGFSEQSARPDKDRFGNETSEHIGGFGDKTERDGAGGRGYGRRGFGYRGRGRPDRNQFSERSDQNRNNAGADDGQVRYEPRPQREGSNDNDGGNFMERSEHDRFTPRRDSRGRRGGYGRGRGGYDRPPRNYRRYGDRRPRQSEGDGETPNDDNKAADGELKQQQSEKLQEGTGGSWAEQIDAADQEAGNEKLNHDVEDGNEAPGDASGEPKLMTLDEWKAREDARRVKAEFNIRKPGEGYNSDPQWKKMFVLSKKEKPDDHEEEEEEDQEEEEHHTKAKNVIPIEIHFADDSVRGARGRGSGRRGGMGGPRGRGSRGGGRGTGRWESEDYRGDSRGAAQSNRGRGSYESRTYVRSGRGGAGGGRRERTPNFADEADFPSLSSPAQP